jgi:hypothetical protein
VPDFRAVVVFLVGEEERSISDEHVQWLIGELMASDDESVALAARLQHARFSREPVELTAKDGRNLLHVFERSMRPRSHDLRALEIGLYTITFAEPGD